MSEDEHRNSPNQTPQTTNVRLALAVDSHGWEDFPTHLKGAPAAEILAGWTAMWHPAVLHVCRNLPTWQRIDVLPDAPMGWLIAVPQNAKSQLAEKERNRFCDTGGVIWTVTAERSSCVECLIEHLQIENEVVDTIDPQTQDFFSLGYCYLQIQLMTRQLRYSGTLDEDLFANQVFDTLDLAFEKDQQAYRQSLQACFDLLCEERIRYYPTTAKIIDYVLLGSSTLGRSLDLTLQQRHPLSLVADGATWQKLSGEQQNVDRLNQKVKDGTITVAGAEYAELPFPLLATISHAAQIQAACRVQQNLVGQQVGKFYARRKFGLRVGLPGLLEQFGFAGVVHCTIDDGVFPQTVGNNMRWEGQDGTVIDALAAKPVPATRPETWLRLGVQIGEAIDMSQYASLPLVRWAGQSHSHFVDLTHSLQFGNVLAEFVTLQQYFDETVDPGFTQFYMTDDYRSPYLQQRIGRCQEDASAPSPIGSIASYWSHLTDLMTTNGMQAMAYLRAGQVGNESAKRFAEIDQALQQATAAVENHDADFETSCDDQRSTLTGAAASEFLKDKTAANGVCLFNPFSFRRRALVKIANANLNHPAVLFADSQQAVVQLPGCSLTQFGNGDSFDTNKATKPPSSKANRGKQRIRKQPPLAEDVYLRNEFFEVEIDEATGGIGVVRKHASRRNLMGQQLVLRKTARRQSRSGGRNTDTTSMVASDIQVTQVNSLCGQISTTGDLKLGTQTVASFKQVVTVTRGMPTVDLQIELDFNNDLQNDPWHEYLASRFAWGDESAEVYGWQNESRYCSSRPRISSPVVVEVNQSACRTAILPGGLPFQQMIGRRKLDCLLVVAGETQRKFNLGIAIDVPYTYQQGLAFLAQPVQADGVVDGRADQAWLFHVNCKNVLVLWWAAIQDSRSDETPRENDSANQSSQGLRVLLKETEGRRVDSLIRVCHDLRAAEIRTLDGKFIRDLKVQAQQVEVSLASFEMVEVSLYW